MNKAPTKSSRNTIQLLEEDINNIDIPQSIIETAEEIHLNPNQTEEINNALNNLSESDLSLIHEIAESTQEGPEAAKNIIKSPKKLARLTRLSLFATFLLTSIGATTLPSNVEAGPPGFGSSRITKRVSRKRSKIKRKQKGKVTSAKDSTKSIKNEKAITDLQKKVKELTENNKSLIKKLKEFQSSKSEKGWLEWLGEKGGLVSPILILLLLITRKKEMGRVKKRLKVVDEFEAIMDEAANSSK